MPDVQQVEPTEEPPPIMALGPASADAAQRRRVLAVVVAIGICAGLGGYFVGRSGGEDVEAARAAGTSAGKQASTRAAERDGYKAGYKQGRRAGYRQTYRKAYKTAYKTATETATGTGQ